MNSRKFEERKRIGKHYTDKFRSLGSQTQPSTRVIFLILNIGSYRISQVVPQFSWLQMTHIHIHLSLYFSAIWRGAVKHCSQLNDKSEIGF
jgi:hypothetical protein